MCFVLRLFECMLLIWSVLWKWMVLLEHSTGLILPLCSPFHALFVLAPNQTVLECLDALLVVDFWLTLHLDVTVEGFLPRCCQATEPFWIHSENCEWVEKTCSLFCLYSYVHVSFLQEPTRWRMCSPLIQPADRRAESKWKTGWCLWTAAAPERTGWRESRWLNIALP